MFNHDNHLAADIDKQCNQEEAPECCGQAMKFCDEDKVYFCELENK